MPEKKSKNKIEPQEEKVLNEIFEFCPCGGGLEGSELSKLSKYRPSLRTL